MAGFYPDVPDHRIPYDRDGTIGLVVDDGRTVVQKTLSDGEMANMNSHTNNGPFLVHSNWKRLVLYFPRLLDISAYYLSVDFSVGDGHYSADTTNGVDGAWTKFADLTHSNGSRTSMRESIQNTTIPGTRAVSFRVNWSGDAPRVRACHLYGIPSSGENTDKLEVINASDTNRLPEAFLDWGDVTQGTSQDRQFRVINRSTTLTANDITLSVGALTDATPSLPPQFTLSDGGSFGATVNIASLAPGATSPIITVRRTTPSDAALSLWWARINTDITSWS